VLRALPADAVLFLGSSSVIHDVDLLGEPVSVQVLTNRGVGGIDGTVSSAVGVALAAAATHRPAYALMAKERRALFFIAGSPGSRLSCRRSQS
jgi:2-succinyl-5-enolpyruvyl-6-hydroxy-3-cyclohexene-1-carboxylate synthase